MLFDSRSLLFSFCFSCLITRENNNPKNCDFASFFFCSLSHISERILFFLSLFKYLLVTIREKKKLKQRTIKHNLYISCNLEKSCSKKEQRTKGLHRQFAFSFFFVSFFFFCVPPIYFFSLSVFLVKSFISCCYSAYTLFFFFTSLL